MNSNEINPNAPETEAPQEKESSSLHELQLRRVRAQLLGGSDAVASWHDKGRMTARERIDALADADSFYELGALAGKGRYDEQGRYLGVTPSNCVMGRARVANRPLMVVADDYTIRGGSSEAAVSDKWIYGERMAKEFRMPLVRLVDSAGGSVKVLEQSGRTKIPGYVLWPCTEMMSQVPVASIAFGACVGLGAVRAIAAHFSVMVKDQSQVCAAGPPVVLQGLGQDVSKEELGGYALCTQVSGIINNVADSEQDALDQVKRFLSYLPLNAWELPMQLSCNDDPQRKNDELDTIIPENRRKTYSAKKIVETIFDRDSMFEISPGYGASLRVYLTRLNGRSVGAMINDPCSMGGGLTRAAATKMERFVDLCDSFHLPIVNLVDQPGVMIGLEAERAGTLMAAARASAAIEQASVPWISIIIRRAFGVAGSMLGPWQGPTGTSLNHRFAWPTARWGSIPIEGGVAAAYRREIEAARDPKAKREELEAYYQRLSSPFRTAENFGVVDIIRPAETRSLLCSWVDDAARLTAISPVPKARGMR